MKDMRTPRWLHALKPTFVLFVGYKADVPALGVGLVFTDCKSATGRSVYIPKRGTRGSMTVPFGRANDWLAWAGRATAADVRDSAAHGSCPVCSEPVSLDGLCETKDEHGSPFLHASCGDGFPAACWFAAE